MKLISADFNAMTEAGHVRLTLPCSQEDIAPRRCSTRRLGLAQRRRIGRRRQLAIDDRYGLVGVPDWDTLVHLDDEGADDFDRVRAELNPLMTKEPSSDEDEPRIFQLLTQMENVAPPNFGDTSRAFFHFRRALALRNMRKLGLALLEMKVARRARPDDPQFVFVYLDLLRLEDFPAAVAEAETITESPGVPALVLSACINILATQAEQMSVNQFESTAERVLALCRRFDQAPDLDQAGLSSRPCLISTEESYTSERAESRRLDRHSKRAHEIYPVGPMLDQLARLQTYDHHARDVARTVREIAARWIPTTTVAA